MSEEQKPQTLFGFPIVETDEVTTPVIELSGDLGKSLDGVAAFLRSDAERDGRIFPHATP